MKIAMSAARGDVSVRQEREVEVKTMAWFGSH
jgi:hypothetical protein